MGKPIPRLALIMIFFAMMAVGPGARAAYPQTMTTSSPFVNLPRPGDDPRWAQAFAHWDKRADTEEALAALAIFEQIARDNPDSFEALLWSCRVNYLVAIRQRDERDFYCQKSIAAGDGALKIKPGDEMASVWRYSSILLLRDLTKAEIQEVQALGRKHHALRPLPTPDDDPLWAEAIKKYDARKDPQQALAAIEDFKKLDAKDPGRIEAKLYINWTYYYLGIIEPTPEGKTELYEKGAQWGRKAMELEPRNPAATFAFASTIGSYAECSGMLSIVRHSLEIGRAIIVVVEEDPTHMYGGFSRYLAASLSAAGEVALRVSEMLGFPRDLIIRVAVFSTWQEPGYLDNHLNLAKMHLALGERDEAKAAFEYVINADPAELKIFEPENLVFQKEARELYDIHFK